MVHSTLVSRVPMTAMQGTTAITYESTERHSVWVYHSTCSLYIEALNIYHASLAEFAGTADKELERYTHDVSNLIRYLRNAKQRGDKFDVDLELQGKDFALLKAVLPLVIERREMKKRKILESNPPPGATGKLDEEIADIRRVMETGCMAVTEPAPLLGKDHLRKEREQLFPPSEQPSAIYNVQNSGIMSFGSHTINVQHQHADASQVLRELMSAVQNAEVLTPEEKQKAKAQIMTVEAQLSDPKPEKTIIKTAYKGMEFLATVGGCAELMTKLASLLSPFLIG